MESDVIWQLFSAASAGSPDSEEVWRISHTWHTDGSRSDSYIERWIKSPLQKSDGELVARDKGTPQGGVISPVLSNLFMHYAFDLWMQRQHSDKPWCRYADVRKRRDD